MDPSVHREEHAVEASHWWFVGRRRLFGRILRDLGVPRDAKILDAGSSTGTNLRMLRDLGYTHAVGLDKSPDAARFCHEKGLGPVLVGDLRELPFASDRLDVVLATDIVEHVEDDMRAAQEIARVLEPGGSALLTVPAFPALWGRQDDVSHHRRRYRRGELERVVERAGLRIVERFYFNWILLPPIWAARQVMRIARSRVDSENQVNMPLLNAALLRLFTLDVRLARRVKPPAGVSLLLLCRKG